ncbi:MAG: DUF4386 family protein [Hyphomonadaceae bacterium]
MRIPQLSASALLFFQAFFIFAPITILGGAIDWPASLDFPPEQTLPLIHTEQAAVRFGYGLYLAWSLAFAGSAALIVRLASGDRALRALSVLAIALGVASALARAIGIVRWLSGSTALAYAYAAAPEGSVERVAIETTQTALNAYGGTIGEDLGVGMFAAMWLACVGALILKDRGLPSWLGWLAFPAAAVSSTPSLALVGITSPIDVVVATTSMLLWLAAVAVVLLARVVRSPRVEPEAVNA